LRNPWLSLLAWIVGVLVALALLVALVGWLVSA